MELIPPFVDSAIKLVHDGLASVVEEVRKEPGGAAMEPLVIALRMHRGYFGRPEISHWIDAAAAHGESEAFRRNPFNWWLRIVHVARV